MNQNEEKRARAVNASGASADTPADPSAPERQTTPSASASASADTGVWEARKAETRVQETGARDFGAIVTFDTAALTIPPLFVVMVSRHHGQWVLVRHKERATLEIPGGHIEEGERAEAAARRELFEETGATEYTLDFVTRYAVTLEGETTVGMLYFADITVFGPMPDFEIVERTLYDHLPSNLTYPIIQPALFECVSRFLMRRGAE